MVVRTKTVPVDEMWSVGPFEVVAFFWRSGGAFVAALVVRSANINERRFVVVGWRCVTGFVVVVVRFVLLITTLAVRQNSRLRRRTTAFNDGLIGGVCTLDGFG